MAGEIFRNLLKDFRVELRSRFAVNLSISFAGTMTVSIGIVTSGVPLSPQIISLLLWMIFFFSAMNGLSHIFVREVDQGTFMFMNNKIGTDAVYLSKLIYNAVFFAVIQVFITPVFIFFLQVEVKCAAVFIATVFSGGLAISATSTFLAAMVSRAGGRGSLFTIMSFPILIPVLWAAINGTIRSLENRAACGLGNPFFLLAFSGMIAALSFLLFRHVWIEE
ncbi:MAG: heme exporter protein CcmB [Spirochaetes bacterium]|nr:heme exporter protein CcmB [Spirochaetota bacterium]